LKKKDWVIQFSNNEYSILHTSYVLVQEVRSQFVTFKKLALGLSNPNLWQLLNVNISILFISIERGYEMNINRCWHVNLTKFMVIVGCGGWIFLLWRLITWKSSLYFQTFSKKIDKFSHWNFILCEFKNHDYSLIVLVFHSHSWMLSKLKFINSKFELNSNSHCWSFSFSKIISYLHYCEELSLLWNNFGEHTIKYLFCLFIVVIDIYF
jgi:hypothetical protein